MKQSHKEILSKIESYLSQPGAEHLRFWQALYNMHIVVPEDAEWTKESIGIDIKDDHNISDASLIARIEKGLPNLKVNAKITVLVNYEEWQDSGHALLDDYKVKRAKVVEVNELTEVNDMFSNITKIKVIS